MKRAIPFLFCFTALLAALVGPREAMALSFARGEILQHNLSICLKKEDAIAILETEAKSGFDAAMAAWNANDNCAPAPVVGGIVGKVVFAIKLTRSDKKLTMSVVEILHEGKVVGYFLTSAPVSEVSADKLGDPKTRTNT